MDPDSPSNETVNALREALRASPNNIHLRQILADTLLGHGQPAEAEKEYREALALSPDSVGLKRGLARAFHQQGKQSHALVIVEDLVKQPNASARAFLLHARLLAGIGEIEHAAQQYRREVETDAAVADIEFASRLGIGANESASEVVDGKVRAAWNDDDALPPADSKAGLRISLAVWCGRASFDISRQHPRAAKTSAVTRRSCA